MANPRLAPNALLKPNQKTAKASNQLVEYETKATPIGVDLTTPLTGFERKKLAAAFTRIKRWWNDKLQIADDLRMIRDERLYREKYVSFWEFCEAEFGLSRSYADRLINAYSIVKELPPGSSITTEGQARALALVPANQRAEVLEEASKNGQPTAAKIKAAAQSKAEEAKSFIDKVGQVIPEEIIPNWKRAEETAKILQSLARKIKNTVAKGFSSKKNQTRAKDVIYAELTNVTVDNALGLCYELAAIKPHAVCPSCGGLVRKTCMLCRGRGFISKYVWNSPNVTEKQKEMIHRKVSGK